MQHSALRCVTYGVSVGLEIPLYMPPISLSQVHVLYIFFFSESSVILLVLLSAVHGENVMYFNLSTFSSIDGAHAFVSKTSLSNMKF